MQRKESLVDALESVLERALKSRSASFRALAKSAGLDPSVDFVGVSLREMDFRDEDLRGFDFRRADLTGADFRRANVDGVRFEGAELIGAIGLPKEHYREMLSGAGLVRAAVAAATAEGLSKDVRLSYHYEEPISVVFGVRNQLVRVLVELIRNAVDAVRVGPNSKKGNVRLVARNTERKDLEILVEDDGVGIPSKSVPLLFDQMFTTKGSGHGFGLAFVAQIIEDHGGTVSFAREAGYTSVRLKIPASSSGRRSSHMRRRAAARAK